jgi:PIN domain nuclease of toxin-antitoxin system
VSVLLDTHILVWWVTEPAKLTAAQKRIFDGRDQAIFVSAASGWEIAIKVKLGKWQNAAPLLPDLANLIERSGLQQLPISLSQAERAGSLPLFHRDPFDRLLVAQALDLDVPIMTVDPVLEKLGCRVI